MKKKILWMVVSGLLVLFLLISACGSPASQTTPATPTTPTTPIPPTTPTTPTTPAAPTAPAAPAVQVPRYGGTLTVVAGEAATLYPFGGGRPIYTNETLWAGDWAKGTAGGYGTKQADYNWGQNDLWDYKTNQIAESVTWTTDPGSGKGTIVYKIRRGIRWALNPNSEASRLVGGRELTVDDVIFTMTKQALDPRGDLYRRNPQLGAANVTKTGPWEVSVTIPIEDMVIGIMRLSDGNNPIAPPEVFNKYGDMSTWKNNVGSGPFILTDYLPGSTLTYIRNSSYWMKDPVGPGKGNQLPYLDGIRELIIPDSSTQLAALRTGKIDQAGVITFEDAGQLQKNVPNIMSAQNSNYNPLTPLKMRTDKAPFNDVRVRRALVMALDWEAINKGLFGGRGNYMHLFDYVENYKYPLYFTLQDSDIPAVLKDMYTYNPDKAKQLLKEAGYPNGFKTNLTIQATQVDYHSIYKDYWSKVGIDLSLQVVDSGTMTSIGNSRNYEGMIVVGGNAPPTIFWAPSMLQGTQAANASYVDDPTLNDGLKKIRQVIVSSGYDAATKLARELYGYVQSQVYIIPNVSSPSYAMWWPWLKGYSGEIAIGYFQQNKWVQYVWIDQALKKSMGK